MVYIYYRNKKIEELCTNFKKATVEFGKAVAKTLFRRLVQIAAFDNFKPIIAKGLFGCHKLHGNRKNCYGIDIENKNRIVIYLDISEDITDLEEITSIIIMEVVNYHD
jgi:plasmid maintenance system killer protein